jgi:hypothetical protein
VAWAASEGGLSNHIHPIRPYPGKALEAAQIICHRERATWIEKVNTFETKLCRQQVLTGITEIRRSETLAKPIKVLSVVHLAGTFQTAVECDIVLKWVAKDTGVKIVVLGLLVFVS